MEGFFKREWEAFKNDMQELGELFLSDPKSDMTPKAEMAPKEDGFFKREWKAFLDDMRGLGEMVMAAFEDDPVLKLCAPKEDNVLDYASVERPTLRQELAQADAELASLFGFQKKNLIE